MSPWKRLCRMLNGRIWLAVMAVCGAWPTAAWACSCGWEKGVPLVQLQAQKARANAIYRARVVSVRPSLPSELGPRGRGIGPERAVVEVLEVFKGKVSPGDTLYLPAGGLGDCSLPFKVGDEHLVYARSSPEDVSMCSRTQPVSGASLELNWLRTGTPPPMPVVLQRESVSCEPCDTRLLGYRVASFLRVWPRPRVMRLWDEDLEEVVKGRGHFLVFSDPSEVGERWRVVGGSWDGDPFEMTSGPTGTDKVCEQTVELRWCKRLDVVAPEPGDRMIPRLQCIEPGDAVTRCDESKSRKSSWLPLEKLSLEDCNWFSLDHPSCWFRTTPVPLEKSEGLGPVLVCSPRSAMSGGPDEMHYCHVEKAPMPTAQER